MRNAEDMLTQYDALRVEVAANEWPDRTGRGPGGDCVEWEHAVNADGYGIVAVGGRMHKVHVLAWILHGVADLTGLPPTHMCGNKLCYRPSHLELGKVER